MGRGGRAGRAVTSGDGEVGQFRALLATGLGWTFADSDVPHLARELHRRSQVHELAHEAYLSRLAAGTWRAELTAIAERLAITETYFFRHGEQFRALSEVALPDRLAARGAQRVLRVLSVGCSSGEEAYALAIAAHRALPDRGWALSVLGLDANPAMVRKAGAACYSAWSLRETPDAVRQTYFPARDGLYEVDARIRAVVTFRQHNITEDEAGLWHAEQYDVIFCRNLLMYLTPEAAAALIRRMTLALTPGGYLFLGHTDSLGSRPDGLEPMASHSTFYYRRPAVRAPIPILRADPPVARAPLPQPLAAPPGVEAHNQILALVHEERFAEALLEIEKIDRARPADRLTHGVLLAQAGRLDEAEALVRELLVTNGMYADAHHLLGVCLEGAGSVDAAIGQYRLGAYLDPVFAMPRLRLGLLARRRGDDRTAATELDRAVHLIRDERDERIVLFGGGFGRTALTAVCRAELDACAVRR
jgi:chemotaxis protein methyltransferase CheR